MIPHIEIYLSKEAAEQYKLASSKEATDIEAVIDRLSRKEIGQAVPILMEDHQVMFMIRAGKLTLNFFIHEKGIFITRIHDGSFDG
jgi:flagella basal body P-ring formation protein FlgA